MQCGICFWAKKNSHVIIVHGAAMMPSFRLITVETLGFRLAGEAHYFTLKYRLIECFHMKGNYLFAI